MRRPRRAPKLVPAAEPNPTGLCNRLADIEKRATVLRGAAMRLAADMADLAADSESLVADMQRVGL